MSGYIGTQPVPQATQTRDSFTATSGQTSFATGGYTPNFLDVYLNGVKLASADYTASNGSDVVLASGAATGDILEVVAFTTFTVGSSFTPSIDDNGNATAITIDASENILVGLTATEAVGTNAGTQLRADGLVYAAVTSDAHILSRRSSDGAILNFRKDTTTVGSIGVTAADNLYVAGSASNHAGLVFNNTAMGAWVNGAESDTTMSLGTFANRFRDLYLSDGVYLGGTGAANKLDDYEEGTWTPIVTGSSTAGTMNYTDRSGRYTKVGRLVTLHFYLDADSGTGSGNLLLGGVPFTIYNAHFAFGSPQWNAGISYPSGGIDANWLRNNSTSFDIRCNRNNSNFVTVAYSNNVDYLRGCITYETDQ